MNEKSLNNLQPVRSEIEARRLGKAGGIKSGKSRRILKVSKDLFRQLLNSDVVDSSAIEFLSKHYGTISKNDLNLMFLGIARIVNDFISPKTKISERIKIYETIRDTVEGKIVENIKIDSSKQEELEIDKKLSKLSIEELTALLNKNEDFKEE